MSNLKCMYWNIHCISSTSIGKKYENPEFLNTISKYDIVCLSELHTHDLISIPGFVLKKQKIRKEKHKGPKISGGIAVFIKLDLANSFTIIPNHNIDSIWLKKKGSNNPLHLAFYYCSPEKSQNKFFDTVNREIDNLSEQSHTYIFGDFNARTKTCTENVTIDKFDHEIGAQCELDILPLPRNSEDLKIVNKRGNEFLDICRIHNLSIANGRTIGDLFGKFTCHQKSGSSVVDYLITSSSALSSVTNFSVGEFQPNLSDHCPIHANLYLQSPLHKEPLQEPNLHDLPKRFIWNPDNRETFSKHIKSDQIKAEVEKLMALPDHPDLTKCIEDLLTNAADSSGIKKQRKNRSNPNPPWFDRECSSLKLEISNTGKLLRKQPDDPCIRETLYVLKRQLRNLVKKNKFRYKKSIVDEMCKDLSKGSQKSYWKLLKKLDKPSDPITVPNQALVDHFKDMLYDPDAPEFPCSSELGPGSLDQEITLEELKAGAKILKPGKLPGMDLISNEMLLPLVETYPSLVLKLFNSILSNIWLRKEWLISIISALHKKGARDDANNYRGISLMACLGKLFLSILNNRISSFVTTNNTLSSGQLGFIKKNRTSDPHIILNTLQQKYCRRDGKKLYGCFVDFSKAFDLVPREILISKLISAGINGNMLEIIKTIYAEDQACVKIGDKHSDLFRTNMGVRQGCVLSPLLFNIFLSDIQSKFDSCGSNPSLVNEEISSLLWADDILLLSTSEKGLQDKLNVLQSYCADNKLKVNTDKTKIMIFNKSGRSLDSTKFYYNKTTLDHVRVYKYLGFCVTPSGEIKTGLEDLRIRALKALAKIRKSLGSHFHSNILNTIHLFNYMVRPILLYCSDFWGCLKQPKNNPITKLHLSFCKQLLGVRKQTNTSCVLLELGSIPILLHAIKATIKNWERIRKHDCSKLLTKAYSECIYSNLTWSSSIRDTFSSNGLHYIFSSTQLSRGNQPLPHNRLFTRLVDQFHQKTFSDIQSSSKLKLYSSLKTDTGLENYLLHISNVKHRQSLTRLRLSSHSLNVETGRHRKLVREDRICTLCRNGVEDETHFLITCPFYKDVRNKFSELFCFSCHLDSPSKVLDLLKRDNMNSVAKYIHEALDLREIMLDSQSTLSDIISKIESCEERSERVKLKSIRTEEALRRKVSKEEERRSKAKEREWTKSLKSKFKEQAKKYAILSKEERRLETERKKEEKKKIQVKKREKVQFDRKLSKLINTSRSLQDKIYKLLNNH